MNTLSSILNFIGNKIANAQPVGSIYMTVDASFDPNEHFIGTWTRIEDKFLLAAGSTYTSGATGGAATVKLTAAESGVPAHSHAPYAANYGYVMARQSVLNGDMGTQTGSGRHYPYIDTNSDGYWARPTSTGQNTAAGASQAHENMPPYLVVNVWQRTA